MKPYYVYAHVRKDNGKVFYIGKGSNNRAYIRANRSDFWKRIVKKHGFIVKIIISNLSENESYKCEIETIAKYKLNKVSLSQNSL